MTVRNGYAPGEVIAFARQGAKRRGETPGQERISVRRRSDTSKKHLKVRDEAQQTR